MRGSSNTAQDVTITLQTSKSTPIWSVTQPPLGVYQHLRGVLHNTIKDVTIHP